MFKGIFLTRAFCTFGKTVSDSITISCLAWIFSFFCCWKINLFKALQGTRKAEIFHSTYGHNGKHWAKLKSTLNDLPYKDGLGPNTWAVLHRFSQTISRLRSGVAETWTGTSMWCQCQRWWLYPLYHNIVPPTGIPLMKVNLKQGECLKYYSGRFSAS